MILADSADFAPALGGALAIFFLIEIAIGVLFIIGWVKILHKAGYSGWWVLMGLVPVANLVMLLVFAFSTWPTIAELRALRGQQYGGGWGYPGTDLGAYPTSGYQTGGYYAGDVTGYQGYPGGYAGGAHQGGGYTGGAYTGGGYWGGDPAGEAGPDAGRPGEENPRE